MYPKLTKYDDTHMCLSEDYEFQAWGHLLTIPKGFVTDGASIPWYFRSLVGCPFSPKTIKSSVIHDYLYRNDFPIACIDRHEKDYLFKKILKEEGNSVLKRSAYYSAVMAKGKDSYAIRSVDWRP